MAYCGPRGIPLSAFLSWSQHDQDAALEWAGYESRRCRGCGSHPDEGARHAHVDICDGCVKQEAATRASKDEPGAHVRLVAGTLAQCPRCVAEHEANKPVRREG
ncbi:hypothetical protein ACTHAM_002353 [Cellulomonas soli]|uniref:hypothetical protein n=1 Tax=Cellulomonas soli TaxID=931535 RepID=UPI003F87F310